MIYLLILLPLMVTMLTIPLTQVVHAQSILDQINQMFSNLTSGLLGNKTMNQPTINSTAPPSPTSNMDNQSIAIANTSSSSPGT